MSTLRPGEKVKISGIYDIIDQKGKKTGKQKTFVKEYTAPATPEKGQYYKLAVKTKH